MMSTTEVGTPWAGSTQRTGPELQTSLSHGVMLLLWSKAFEFTVKGSGVMVTEIVKLCERNTIYNNHWPLCSGFPLRHAALPPCVWGACPKVFSCDNTSASWDTASSIFPRAWQLATRHGGCCRPGSRETTVRTVAPAGELRICSINKT